MTRGGGSGRGWAGGEEEEGVCVCVCVCVCVVLSALLDLLLSFMIDVLLKCFFISAIVL